MFVPAECPPAVIAAYEDVDATSGADRIRALFAARVEAQEALDDAACVDSLRTVDYAARVAADRLYEALPVDERPDAWLSVDGDGRPELRTGDVLVTRAVALSSAGIAHLGEQDGHFSHNALVYVAPDGEVWTVSAFMEKGAVVEPLDEFLASGLGRVVVLRHEDAELAERAGAAAYERIAEGPHVPYDDAMDDGDSDALFCSEIARWAYGPLLGEPATIPLHPTTFGPESDTFLDAMGIEVRATSMPGDALYDPRFAVVAEWRSVEDLAEMRRHDAIAESAFAWMEQGDYVVDPTAGEAATVSVGLAFRRTPVLALLVKDRILPTSDPDFLLTGLAFDTAGRALDEALVERVGEVSLSRLEWLAEIEAVRAEDEATWTESPRKSLFHKTLHPR